MLKNYMMKKSEMPRISKEELCENLDAILERVDKENIGFVITNNGKDDLVLCPAWWFGYCFDETFNATVKSAVEGALHSDGLNPGMVCDFVRKHLNVIDIETLDALKNIIENALKNPSTIPNSKAWELLLDDLIDQKEDFQRRMEIIRKARESDNIDELSINIDLELLKKSAATVVKLGMTLNEAIVKFLEELVKRGRMPFDSWSEADEVEVSDG